MTKVNKFYAEGFDKENEEVHQDECLKRQKVTDTITGSTYHTGSSFLKKDNRDGQTPDLEKTEEKNLADITNKATPQPHDCEDLLLKTPENVQSQQKRIASLFSKPEETFDAYQAQGLTGNQSAICNVSSDNDNQTPA